MIDSETPRDEEREFKMADAMDATFEEAKAERERADRLESLAYGREDGSGGRTDISDDLAEAERIRTNADMKKEGMEAAGNEVGLAYDAAQSTQVTEAREAILEAQFDEGQERDSIDPSEAEKQ